jgi:hypothetical protein
LVVYLVGDGKDIACRNGEEVAEGAVAIPAHQLCFRAYVFLPFEALVAGAAEHVRVDHDPGSGVESRHRVLKGPNHLVPEDKRIVHWNLAAEDAEVGAADPYGTDAYDNIFSIGCRLRTLLNMEALRFFQDYDAHVNYSPRDGLPVVRHREASSLSCFARRFQEQLNWRPGISQRSVTLPTSTRDAHKAL